MIFLLHMQINVCAIAILLIMLINNRRLGTLKNTPDQKLFRLMCMCLIFMLFFESLSWLFDAQSFYGARLFNITANTILYLLSPLNYMLWTMFGEHKIIDDYKVVVKHRWVYFLPVAANTVFILANLQNGLCFYLDDSNAFHRGSLSFLPVLLHWSYFIMAYFFVYRRLDKSDKSVMSEFAYFFIKLPLIPVACCVLQCFMYGTNMLWIGFFLSVFIVFVNVQNDKIYIDALTGIYNREFVDKNLNKMLDAYDERQLLFLLMIDMDGFKAINDSFGHQAGDNALVSFADILVSVCNKKYIISRFGGDEFMILGRCVKTAEIENLISDIEHSLKNFNNISELGYELSCSIGFSVYSAGESTESFIDAADKSMYEVKLAKKAKGGALR